MRFQLSMVLLSVLLSCSQEMEKGDDNLIGNGIPINYDENTLFKKDRCSFEEAVEKILKSDTIGLELFNLKEEDMPIFESAKS